MALIKRQTVVLHMHYSHTPTDLGYYDMQVLTTTCSYHHLRSNGQQSLWVLTPLLVNNSDLGDGKLLCALSSNFFYHELFDSMFSQVTWCL